MVKSQNPVNCMNINSLILILVLRLGKRMSMFGKYPLKYMGVKRHNVCKLLSQGSKKNEGDRENQQM